MTKFSRFASLVALTGLVAALFAAVGPPAVASSPTFIRGECNGDGNRDIADAIYSLAVLFSPNPPVPPCRSACDTNDDGQLNIADPVFLLSHLFNAVSIPQPSDQCGIDPTPDFLDCFQETGSCQTTISLSFGAIALGGFTSLPTQETIIRDDVEWAALWAIYASGFSPEPPLPPVDFTTQMVVVIVEPVTGPETRIEVVSMLATINPLTLDQEIEVLVERTFCPSAITIIEIPFTIVVADAAPGALVVQTFDGGCPL